VSLLPPSPLTDELAASGIPVTSLNMRRGLPDPRALPGLLRELREFQPHIVHSHMTHANLLARAARVWHGGPVWINTLHGMTMANASGRSSRIVDWSYRLSDGLADLTTVVSTPARASYITNRTVSRDKIAVQYNGVDCERLRRVSAAGRAAARQELGVTGEFVWLAVGRLQPVKDYHTMLRAFHEAGGSGPRPQLLAICGVGEEESSLRGLAAECGIAERVRFLGMRRDVPELMGAADAYVLSSRSEGLPMVLLEASSCGLPIVATAVGGNGEIVEDGRTGFLAAPLNPGALAAAMARLAGMSADERAQMAEAGRAKTARQFGRERVLDEWEEIYRRYRGTQGRRKQ
jgi:glycosyltransferase involved in cell wall biosynthesis